MRAALGDAVGSVEAIEVLSETALGDLPGPAQERLGIRSGQKNLLVRIVLRDHDRTLTHEHANELRDRIYAALHEGSRQEWASSARGSRTP